jgi:hypothetical protein
MDTTTIFGQIVKDYFELLEHPISTGFVLRPFLHRPPIRDDNDDKILQGERLQQLRGGPYN